MANKTHRVVYAEEDRCFLGVVWAVTIVKESVFWIWQLKGL